MVTLTLKHLFGDPNRIGRAEASAWGVKLNLAVIDLSQHVLLTASLSGWWVSARIVFSDGPSATIVPQSSLGGSINLENEDITDLLIGKSGTAEIQIIGHTTTSGGKVFFRGGSLTFEENPVLTKTRVEASLSRIVTKDNDGTVTRTTGQVIITNDSEVDILVQGSLGIDEIVSKNSVKTIEINFDGGGDKASFGLFLIGDPIPYKEFSFSVSTQSFDFSATAKILDLVNYLEITGEFATFVTQMFVEIDNTRSQKPTTVTASINYFGSSSKSFDVPPGSVLVGALEHFVLDTVSAIQSTRGTASILDKTITFRGSTDFVIGSPPPLPEPGSTPEPEEGLSLDTKVGIVLAGVAVVIGVAFGAVLAQKPR